ncbi:MAG: tRNA glutamyl-Q(34) synthetase GluQRS [Ilumatobacteraceae bacterium]
MRPGPIVAPSARPSGTLRRWSTRHRRTGAPDLPASGQISCTRRGGAISNEGFGRFAPSPTGDLHLGNLRTAVVAWLLARRHGLGWLVRMEDLDPVTSSAASATAQLDDLHRLGLRSAAPIVHQSQRFELYEAAIDRLAGQGLVYECFCTRREIREAAQAPNAAELPDGAYPGTCRTLSDADRRRFEREGRRPALRLRTGGERLGFDDLILGRVEGAVDDVVLRRNDGVPAYNLAVVVDDAAQGVVQVVRGDDLASSTPRQLHLQRLLGLPQPQYAHVPLALGSDGTRLAKRHGAVSLTDLAALGIDADAVVALIGASLGACAVGDHVTVDDLLATFEVAAMPRTPWQVDPAGLSASIGP